MITTATFTLHALERSKKRRNIKNIRSAVKNIELAVKRGKRAEDFTSWEKEYLIDAVYDEAYAIAYDNFCYIMNFDNTCITMYPLPKWFGKKKRFDGKERIRDYKKYWKNNSQYIELYAVS